jgi:UDP-2,4-diacetamido-2,4,6-trideoxy-beta-L-altropyranose hydrolase
MRYLIRSDASFQIGSGHVMRCLTLAEALRKAGAEVEFVCRTHLGNLNELIRHKKFVVHELLCSESHRPQIALNTPDAYIHWLDVSQEQDASETIAVFQNKCTDWLIVDHYALNQTWEQLLRPHVRKIMVIDDLVNYSHDCDLLLNQNFRTEALKKYQNLVPNHCRLLLGTNHVLLRSEFDYPAPRNRTGEIQSIFVYFGGNDIYNQAGRALTALTHFPQLKVFIVLGLSHPHASAVKTSASKYKHIHVITSTTNMAGLMRSADLGFGTCGVAAWERCAMGLPSLVTVSAENQREDANVLHRLGAVEFLGESQHVDEIQWQKALNRLFNDPDRVRSMGELSLQVVSEHHINRLKLLNLLQS